MMEVRGSGRTTKQMREAPEGATFIWVHSDLHYPLSLAAHLGRRDLRIARPDWLTDLRWRGRINPKAIVVDHAAVLTAEQRRAYVQWEAVMHGIDSPTADREVRRP